MLLHISFCVEWFLTEAQLNSNAFENHLENSEFRKNEGNGFCLFATLGHWLAFQRQPAPSAAPQPYLGYWPNQSAHPKHQAGSPFHLCS
jgi:hypothetical protein